MATLATFRLRGAALSLAVVASAGSFIVLDPNDFAQQLGNDLPWAIDNVPFFECDDYELTSTYFFRWTSYKLHINATMDSSWGSPFGASLVWTCTETPTRCGCS
jgi:hypothetical protein